MKRVKLCFLSFLIISVSFAQKTNLDSLVGSIDPNALDTNVILLTNKLANQYRIQGDLKEAKKLALKALDQSNQIEWEKGKATAYNSLAYICIYESDFEGSMSNALKALSIAEPLQDKENMGFSYLYIGYTNLCIGEEKEVYSYYKKALQIRLELKNYYDIGYSYSYIGNYFTTIKNADSSIFYHKLALESRIQSKDKRSIADSYLLLGQAYYLNRNSEIALELMDKALVIYLEIDDKRRLAETYRNYADVCMSKNDWKTSEIYLKKSIKLSRETGGLENLVPAFDALALVNERQRNYPEAYDNLRTHLMYSDSINNEEVYKQATKQILKFKARKEAKIKQLEYQKEKAVQEKNATLLIAKNKVQKYVLIGAFVLILFLGLISILIARTLNLTKQQKKITEEQNAAISDSIDYAKRIQTAILPSIVSIKQSFHEAFVFYKPKDVVAGDFYWLDQIHDPKMEADFNLFAVADCTGHGVPGAMLSVVCHNALNRAVRELNTANTGLILDKTREIVVTEFEKSDVSVSDGMDIALCAIHDKKLFFSGANNPVWILRNKEIIVIKGDKQPIGRFSNSKPYTTHEVELMNNDTIFVFSDGYADQFGGSKNRKFGHKNLRNLLIDLCEKSLDQQKIMLEKTLNEWIQEGNDEQIDDICIVGIRPK